MRLQRMALPFILYNKMIIHDTLGLKTPLGRFSTPHAELTIAARGNAQRRTRRFCPPQKAVPYAGGTIADNHI